MKNFVIFDVNRPIMADNVLTVAKTPIEAVKKYMKENQIEGTPKRSGSNHVRLSCKEYIVRDGVRYYSHKPTQWYEVVTN